MIQCEMGGCPNDTYILASYSEGDAVPLCLGHLIQQIQETYYDPVHQAQEWMLSYHFDDPVKEYSWMCNHCRGTVRTTDPPGTTCDCGGSQRDWMVNNRKILAARVKRGHGLISELTEPS